MQTAYTPAQKKASQKRILSSLFGCYSDEYRAGFLIGSEDHKVAREMVANSQIKGGKIEGKYEYFAPIKDMRPYRK